MKTSEKIVELKSYLDVMTGNDKKFAASLVRQFEAKGSLTDKQWPWIERLIERAEVIGVPDFTKEFSAVSVGEFSGVIELFKKAKQHLKYPQITLVLPDGSPLQLAVAGCNSKYAGMVKLTDGKPFGQNNWYGTVSEAGVWDPGIKAEAIKNDLLGILTKLAKNPARVAAEYGKLSGRCCFCHSTLTEEKSTDVGYGPVCAKRWGLPWGVKKPVEAVS